MTRTLVAVAFSYLIASGVLAPAARADFADELRMSNAAEAHEAFIEAFAANIRDNKEQDVLSALDPASIEGAGSEQVLGALRADVFPFFADFKRLSGYESVTKAEAPDGRVGLWHYTFIEDGEGHLKPFQIAIVESSGGLKVLGIEVGQCVKGRHPRVKPCK